MNQRKKAISVFLLAILIVGNLSTPNSGAQDILPPNAFLIRNRSDQVCEFWLRKGAGDWKKYTLEAKARDTYEDKDQIWIENVGREPLHKGLILGNRYVLLRDATWDIKPMKL